VRTVAAASTLGERWVSTLPHHGRDMAMMTRKLGDCGVVGPARCFGLERPLQA